MPSLRGAGEALRWDIPLWPAELACASRLRKARATQEESNEYRDHR